MLNHSETTLSSLPAASLRLTKAQDNPAMPAPALDETEADALLQELVLQRWARLSSEYDDPLGVLFTEKARQWTAGWGQDGNLYLLVWELQSWEQKPLWCLYRNGALLYREEEGYTRSRSDLCQKLLESDQLPFLTHEQLLAEFSRYGADPGMVREAARHLLDSILGRPEIFTQLKEPLFAFLEADLGNPDWPLLEVMKLHRLSHKNPVVWLFQQFVKTGLMRLPSDLKRLDSALTRLQQDYTLYGSGVFPFMQPAYDAAFYAFRQILTDGSWRIKLRFQLV